MAAPDGKAATEPLTQSRGAVATQRRVKQALVACDRTRAAAVSGTGAVDEELERQDAVVDDAALRVDEHRPCEVRLLVPELGRMRYLRQEVREQVVALRLDVGFGG